MSHIDPDDTIAAIATPAGEGGISVIRLSGPLAFKIAEDHFKPGGKKKFSEFESHTVHLGSFFDFEKRILDEVLVTVFKTPHSYTGEDLIEISAHGGLVVTRKILQTLLAGGARPAEPGEFTKRAFLNGKLDLTQAEAVLDLIKAKSDRSAQTAARQLVGALSGKFQEIKQELMKMHAHMEAFLDFPDEDLEIFSDQTLLEKYAKAVQEIQKLIAGFERGSLIREGVTLVLVGKPNVGKSSLFNSLLARDRALVSEIPGTTRDVLEEALEINGWYLRLIDTAGLAASAKDTLDAMGMARTKQVMEQGSLFLFLVDGSEAPDEKDGYVYESIPENKPVIHVMNKVDLKVRFDALEFSRISSKTKKPKTDVVSWIKISTKERMGLEELEKQITFLLTRGGSEEEGEQITRLRHKRALEKALEALLHSQASFQSREPLEFVIENLKTALSEMRELIGEIYSEDLLDIIFSEFCIGK